LSGRTAHHNKRRLTRNWNAGFVHRAVTFVAYLTNFPRSLNINHGVLVMRGKPNGRTDNGTYRYAVYDPNHHDAPRTLEWSERDRCFVYQHDTDFVGAA